MKQYPSSISHDEAIIGELRKDKQFAIEYLKSALEDGESPEIVQVILRQITMARGGITKVAKAAGVDAKSLARAFSAKKDPCVLALMAVTKAMGFKLTVEAA